MDSREWAFLTVGEVCENHDALRRPVKESDRKKGPFPYYGASGIIDWVDGFTCDGEYVLVAEDGENLRTRKTPIAFRATGKFWVNNHAHVLRGGPRMRTRFIAFALEHANVGGYLTGSTMPKLTQGNLSRIPLVVPPLRDQDGIIEAIGGIEDLIAVLTLQNRTLEAIARALFRSWFVDFDPVRAKMEGRPTGLPDDVAALFPDRLVETPDGEVPEGWRTDRLSAALELAYGKALKEEVRQPGTVPVYGSNGQVGWHAAPFVAGPGIVVGRKGNPGTVVWVPDSFWPIDTTFYVVPKWPGESLHYLRYTLELQGLAHLGSDSAVPGLNRNIAYANTVIDPGAALREAFAEMVGPLLERVAANDRQSRTLAALRDTLLPKLLSGEVRVPAEEVATP